MARSPWFPPGFGRLKSAIAATLVSTLTLGAIYAKLNAEPSEKLVLIKQLRAAEQAEQDAKDNAKRAQALTQEFGSLASYFWRYEPQPGTRPAHINRQTLSGVTTSPESVALSKDLRKRGWTFVGPTTMYAFMQAMGLVNDHLEGCGARVRALEERAGFKVPR